MLDQVIEPALEGGRVVGLAVAHGPVVAAQVAPPGKGADELLVG
jgi:hypothetical protein